MNEVIEAHGLTKCFRGRTIAVKDLELQVRRGSVYGLIGRNGSGKTTALRMLLGLLRADSGEARVLGWDLWQAPRTIRRRVSYVCQGQHLPERASLEQLCWYLERYNERWAAAEASRMAESWGLPWRQPLGCLSAGQQRQAAMVLALASRPEVLLLDEPAAGLDPVARRELIEQLSGALSRNEGCTVILSTHLVGDLERMADEVGILDRGRMALSMPLEKLLHQIRRVQVVFDADEAPAEFSVPGVLSEVRNGPVVNAVVRWTNDQELEALRSSVDARVQVFPMGLEEIFIHFFGNHASEAEPGKSMVLMRDWS